MSGPTTFIRTLLRLRGLLCTTQLKILRMRRWVRLIAGCFNSRLANWSYGWKHGIPYLIVRFCFNQHNSNQQFNWRAGVHTHAWCTGFHLRNNCSETTPPHSSETTPQWNRILRPSLMFVLGPRRSQQSKSHSQLLSCTMWQSQFSES